MTKQTREEEEKKTNNNEHDDKENRENGRGMRKKKWQREAKTDFLLRLS